MRKNDNNNDNSGKKRFNIFKPFRNSYTQTKSDEERKQKSIKFGLFAILFSGICIGLCYPCVWLGVQGIKFAFTHNLGALTYILGIGNLVIAVAGVGVMLIPYYLWFQGLFLVIMQLGLNRRFIGWLALIVWLGSVVLIFMLSIDSFAHLFGIGTVWFFK